MGREREKQEREKWRFELTTTKGLSLVVGCWPSLALEPERESRQQVSRGECLGFKMMRVESIQSNPNPFLLTEFYMF